MLYYPKMPGSRNGPNGRCLAFEKYDGTNLHWEWDRNFGWVSIGTRRERYDISANGLAKFARDHPQLASAQEVFEVTYAEALENVFTENEFYRDAPQVVAFAEFFGPNSFAGMHKEDDPKQVVLFDVLKEGYGMIGPFQFREDFGHVKRARVVYEGKLTGKFAEDVRRGKYGVAEGVVCKGGKTPDELWMAKIKTYAYMEKLKQAFAEDWEKYWE